MSETTKRTAIDIGKILSPLVAAAALLWGIFSEGVKLEAKIVTAFNKLEQHDEKINKQLEWNKEQQVANIRQDGINKDLYDKHNYLQEQFDELYRRGVYNRNK
jgi:hypothetical protein